MNHPGRWCGLAVGVLAALVGVRAAAAQADAGDKEKVVDAKLQERINRAVDRGVKYYKTSQNPQTGLWRFTNHDVGASTLVAWALLESGVPANDPVIQRAAAAIRQAFPNERRVYELSLDIFFFDKLGEPEDIPLIEAAAVRLMGAQAKDGEWTYTTSIFDVAAAEQARLTRLIASRRGGGAPAKLPRVWAQLDPNVQRECVRLHNRLAITNPVGDNSNTQFAMIALWVARKYGLPVEPYLARTGQRFFNSQQDDGSWFYTTTFNMPVRPPDQHTPAMTCAGLLGLFIGAANQNAARPDKNFRTRVLQWERVQRGFKYLAAVMHGLSGKPADKNHFYLLWSLERVGMAYDTKLISGVDWYQWAATWLVDRQKEGGNWTDGGFQDCDGAFALLVLKRVNVLKNALPPVDVTIGETAITKEPKKKGPKAKPKDDLPPIDLNDGLISPKGEKKGGAGKTGGPGGRQQSSWLDRPGRQQLAWQAPPRPAALERRRGLARL
jgi:hypothetical protein